MGLATADTVAAKAFYTRLFGWQAEDQKAGAAGTYTALRRCGREVAILYSQQPEARAAGAPPHWTSYISVEDADATAARADELGGAAVFRAPFDVLDAGRVAAIRDPTGAIVSLWQPRSQFGAELVNDVGAPSWNELATTDVERAKSFFGDLLGWEYETGDGGYVWIRNAGRLNGGMREQSEAERGVEPNWLPYFTVSDAEESARQAEQLGGRRLGPTASGRSGQVAVIADPQGATFAAFDRSEADVASIAECRLDLAGLNDQRKRYRALAPYVVEVDRRPGALQVRFGPNVDSRLLEQTLAVERECCPFFRLEYATGPRVLSASVERAEQDAALEAIAYALTV